MPSYDTRSRGNFGVLSPSRKGSSGVLGYSLNEGNAARLLEFSPEVVTYRSCQDRTFHLQSPDGDFKYTPDFEAVLRDGSVVFIEVKPNVELRRPSVRKRLAHAKAGMALLGYALYVWDEPIYKFGVRHSTISSLLRLRGMMTRDQKREARMLVASAQPKTLRELTKVARSEASSRIWIANGIVGIDLEVPLSATSEIYIDPPEMRHDPIFA